MKKTLLIFAIAFAVNTAFSQFQVGPKFGMNFSKQKSHSTGETTADFNTEFFNDGVRNKMGYNFGLMMNMGGDHVFNFQPEFMYVMRGYNFSYTLLGTTINQTQKNNYLDINLLFNLGKTTETWRAYAILGPAFDFWLSKSTYDSDGTFIKDSDKFSFNDNSGSTVINTDVRMDFAFVLGVGFKYRLGPGWITFSPRYKLGFVPQTLEDYGSVGGVSYRTNKGIYVDFGYAFQFGGEEN